MCTKGKVSLRCLLAEPVTQVTRFSMPLEPSFGIMPQSSALSQLHTLCTLCTLCTKSTDNLSEMCPLKRLAFRHRFFAQLFEKEEERTVLANIFYKWM